MSELTEFLTRNNIKKEDYDKTGLDWKDLLQIKSDYEEYIKELKTEIEYIAKILHDFQNVHSIRYRIKEPDRLLAKIIRKKKENTRRKFTLKNYKTKITDLMGLRAIYLYKSNWMNIHESIKEQWKLNEPVIAKCKNGDQDIKMYEEYGIKTETTKNGYRSVHYIIKHTPRRKKYLAEIQLRTIFEEGWSEIDHEIRYPFNMDNPFLNAFLDVFNKFAGGADDMASFVKLLYYKLLLSFDKQEEEIKKLREELDSERFIKIKKDRINDIINNISNNYLTSSSDQIYLYDGMKHPLIIQNSQEYVKMLNEIQFAQKYIENINFDWKNIPMNIQDLLERKKSSTEIIESNERKKSPENNKKK